jgi:hypothetical protein
LVVNGPIDAGSIQRYYDGAILGRKDEISATGSKARSPRNAHREPLFVIRASFNRAVDLAVILSLSRRSLHKRLPIR